MAGYFRPPDAKGMLPRLSQLDLYIVGLPVGDLNKRARDKIP